MFPSTRPGVIAALAVARLTVWRTVLAVASLALLSAGCSGERKLSPRDQKAAEYFSGDPSVVIGRVSNVFYFSKQNDPHGGDPACKLCGPLHRYFITFKVERTINGKDWSGTELGCCLDHSSEKLELKDTYYLGYDDQSKKVFFIEPGNLCPAEKIWERNR